MKDRSAATAGHRLGTRSPFSVERTWSARLRSQWTVRALTPRRHAVLRSRPPVPSSSAPRPVLRFSRPGDQQHEPRVRCSPERRATRAHPTSGPSSVPRPPRPAPRGPAQSEAGHRPRCCRRRAHHPPLRASSPPFLPGSSIPSTFSAQGTRTQLRARTGERAHSCHGACSYVRSASKSACASSASRCSSRTGNKMSSSFSKCGRRIAQRPQDLRAQILDLFVARCSVSKHGHRPCERNFDLVTAGFPEPSSAARTRSASSFGMSSRCSARAQRLRSHGRHHSTLDDELASAIKPRCADTATP